MKRLFASSAAAMLALCSLYAFADELKSGLAPGDAPDAFYVKDCTGPAQGKDPLCYRCRYGDRPVVCVFTREINEDVASLVKQIDEKVTKNEDKKMAAFVVLLTEDEEGAGSKLKAFAEKHKIENVPLTTFKSMKGPAGYNISPDAVVSVMMWEQSSVKVNHAFPKGKFNKEVASKVVAETSKILN